MPGSSSAIGRGEVVVSIQSWRYAFQFESLAGSAGPGSILKGAVTSNLPFAAAIASAHYLQALVAIVLVDEDIRLMAGRGRRTGRLLHRVRCSTQISRRSVKMREIRVWRMIRFLGREANASPAPREMLTAMAEILSHATVKGSSPLKRPHRCDMASATLLRCTEVYRRCEPVVGCGRLF